MDFDFFNWMLVFTRAGAFVAILPIFSTPNIPRQIRIALGALLAFLVAPGLPPFAWRQAAFGQLVFLFFQEVGVGLLIGFVTRMVFYATDLAGHIIANEMGLNMASLFDPWSGESTQAPGTVLFYLTAVTMMSLDMHHWLLTGFHHTYSLLPIGAAHLREALLVNIIGHTSRLFLVAVQMAGPLIAVSFIIMLVFSVLGRAVPQMNVFTESFAIRVLGGLAVFGFTLEITAQHILNYLRRLPEDMMHVAQFLGGA